MEKESAPTRGLEKKTRLDREREREEPAIVFIRLRQEAYGESVPLVSRKPGDEGQDCQPTRHPKKGMPVAYVLPLCDSFVGFVPVLRIRGVHPDTRNDLLSVRCWGS